MDNKTLVPQNVLEKLIRDQIFLEFLIQDGVDNWGSYCHTLKEYCRANGNEDTEEFLCRLTNIRLHNIMKHNL